MGIVYGIVSAKLCQLLLSTKYYSSMYRQFSGLLGEFVSNRSDVVLISLCAAVGEEIFFRGAIQYYLGIYWTSVLLGSASGSLS